MRILIITQNFPPLEGGISTHCYEMAKHWAMSEDVWVLAPHMPGEGAIRISPSLRVVRMPGGHNKLFRFFVTMLYTFSVARRIKPNLIYGTHWRNCGVALRLLAPVMGIPFFLAIHGSEILYLLNPKRAVTLHLFRWVAQGCRGFVALGQYQKQLLQKLGIEAWRIYTCPEGVDLTRFTGLEADGGAQIRARYHLDSKRVILTVGRLVERKGHDMVIRALPEVVKEVPEAVYLIVGRGPMEDRLRALSREMGVEDRVVFCGFVPESEILSYYQACDVFAMPNREVGGDTEGFGIVFAEAGACGKPVIGGRSGGVVEVIEDGVTGFLVDPLDPREIGQALRTLLQNAVLAAEMGKAGRKRVEALYRYDRIAANILTFLKQSVGNREAASCDR